MTRAFVWFVARSTANRVRRQLRQLRSPRYAIALLIGLAYFAFLLSGLFTGSSPRGMQAAARQLDVIATVAPLMFALMASWWWLWGGHRRAILLSPAETHLLLPAPLSRAALIRFKLLQAQVPILLSATIFTLLSRAAPLPVPLRFVSIWMLFATLHLHQIAASLVHAAAGEHGGRGLRRNAPAVVLFGVGFTVIAFSLMRALAAARGAGSVEAALAAVIDVFSQPAPRLVLLPFRLLLTPTLAPSATAWIQPAAFAALVLALHYLWVQRTNAAFEETATAEGERQARDLDALRAGGLGRLRFSRTHRPARLRRPLLPLAPAGWPAYALFWKNVVYVQRLVRASTFIVLAAAVAGFTAINVAGGRATTSPLRAAAVVLFVLTGGITVIGALAFRNDLRMDLQFIDRLRTYPLRGRDVVIACVAATVACMSAVQLVALLAAIFAGLLSGLLTLPLAALVLGACLLALPVLNVVAVLLQNAIALLYPAWARLGAYSGGMDSMGQGVLTLLATVIMFALIALPPLALGVVVGLPLALLLGTPAVVPAALVVLAGLAGEALLVTRWLGRVYDTMDPIDAQLLR